MALPLAAGAMIGAGITAAAGLGSSYINYLSTKKSNQQQYQYNKQLAEMAYKQNVEQWMRENAYNTPSMQMARMRAAGINPTLPFGEGAEVSSGNAGASPQLSYPQFNPQVPFFDASSPIQNAFQAYMLQAKRSNIEADTALKNNSSRKVEREIDNLEVDYSIKKEQLRGLGLSNEAQEIANNFLEREKEAKIAALESESNLNKEQKRQVKYITDNILPKEVQLKDKELQDFQEKWNKWKKEVELWASQQAKTDAEKDLLVKDAENYALNHASNGFLGSGLSIQNVVRAGMNSIKKSARISSARNGDRGAHPSGTKNNKHGFSRDGSRTKFI